MWWLQHGLKVNGRQEGTGSGAPNFYIRRTPPASGMVQLMNADHRRLLARATKAEDDVQLLRERLAAAYQEIHYARSKAPVKVHQVSCGAPAVPVASDPLMRLFAAISPKRYRATPP